MKDTSFLHFGFLEWLTLEKSATNEYIVQRKESSDVTKEMKTNLPLLQSFKVYPALPCALP
jgi:hypothetical protein